MRKHFTLVERMQFRRLPASLLQLPATHFPGGLVVGGLIGVVVGLVILKHVVGLVTLKHQPTGRSHAPALWAVQVNPSGSYACRTSCN